MKNPWTLEEEEILRKAWLGEDNFKRQLNQIPLHSYHAAVSHARDVMKLGPRVNSDRGALAWAWNEIKSALEIAAGSVTDIMDRTSLSQSVIDRHLKKSNPGMDGEVHVSEWRKGRRGGRAAAVYSIGPGENAPYPATQTPSEKGKLFKVRRRMRKTGVTMNNPFAPAAGFVAAPKGKMGRVYIHLTDSKYDDLEMAA